MTSNYTIQSYSPYSPAEQTSSASSHAGSGYESLTLAPINPDANFDIFDFNDDNQFFDSLPRLQSPNPYMPESSNSRDQEQQSPPSNQEALDGEATRNFFPYQISESPDPFDDFIEQDFVWPQSPRPHQNAPSRNTTRASSFVDLTESSPPPSNMPPTTRKRKAESTSESRSVRLRSATPKKSFRTTPTPKQKVETADVVDLVDIEGDNQYADFQAKSQAEAIKQQQQEEANKPVRLAEFQCIICMDNPTDLTVTHCGHLFCSFCLHEALYAGNAKKCCPVCRATVSTAGIGKGDQKKQPKNGVFALEMKLMTANKKGKQPVRAH